MQREGENREVETAYVWPHEERGKGMWREEEQEGKRERGKSKSVRAREVGGGKQIPL
jgi:hypothetical protein